MSDVQAAQPKTPTASAAGKLPEMEGEALTYFLGENEPVTSSVLISNSRYLNNPYYRETFAMYGLRRYGHDLPTTYLTPMLAKALAEVTDVPYYLSLMEAEKAKCPEFRDWLSRGRHTSYRREDLEGMVPGTLGHEIWKLLSIPGIKMDLGPGGGQIDSDLGYINTRRGANHDIEHIVTGFGPYAAGELALGVANITVSASYFTPEFAHELNAGIVLINSVVMQRTSLHYPAALPVILEAYKLGIEMGQALKRPLLIEPWEEMLDMQVEDIATRLGITRGPGEGWEWTTSATTG